MKLLLGAILLALAGRSILSLGSVCGISLPSGLKLAEKLESPIYTPSSKAAAGEHDANISFAETEALVGADLAKQIRDKSLSSIAYASRACL